MPWETRYSRPDDRAIESVVQLALDGYRVDRRDWEFVESGSSSVVVLAGSAAVRVARDRLAGGELRRVQQLVDRLPELPFAVPRSLAPVVDHDGLVAVANRRLAGSPHPRGSGDSQALRGLLDAIHTVDVAPLRPWLAPARSFAGGPAWLEVMANDVLPRLPDDVKAEAHARMMALAGLQPRALCLNHGDLAGANILWQDDKVVGLLDWDLAADDDPAEDLASLAGWHGWHLINELAEPEIIRRAETFRGSFPLQIVAFQIVHHRSAEELTRAIDYAASSLRSTTAR